jgi:serine/threonine protein kinase/formylglycine-generating enzyme required for sulfatase activity
MNLPDSILDALLRHGVKPSAELRAELETLWSGRKGFFPRPTWRDDPGASLPPGLSPDAFPPRYRPVDTLGVGGMGLVLAAQDQLLGRVVAMKIAHRDLSRASRSRFLAEAQVVAQLQHPGIVPVYDLGELPSGEPYFTMPIVRGRTLSELIREVHRASVDGWRPTPTGVTLHRLLWAFQQVCDAIGYAHSRGVVHRDLKPDNVIVGDHGETVVVDWGLAKVMGQPEEPIEPESPVSGEPVITNRMTPDGPSTMVGAVIGTLGYMPPEQARGELSKVDRRADVHALGATLYEILCDAPPFSAPDVFDTLTQVFDEPVPPVMAPGVVPPELRELAMVCIQKDPDRRPPDAEHVAKAVSAWLDGAGRRERALAEVEVADRWLQEIERLRAECHTLEREAQRVLAGLPSRATAEAKYEGWRLQDRAREAAANAELLEVRRVEVLSAALRTDPHLIEAHQRLADHFRTRHERAEASGDLRHAAELLQRLRTHDVNSVHAAYVEGTGTVTLLTEPAGARVIAHRYEERDRRLVAVPFERLGTTPLLEARLPMGSYRLDLVLDGHVTAHYPVHLPRCARWTGALPGTDAPVPIVLPREDELGPDDRYVPAGLFRAGGDPFAEWPRHEEHVWVDAFVIRRHPVTNGELLAFLNALVDSGREEEALRYHPRFGSETAFGRDERGRFVLVPDSDGHEWLPGAPAVLVDWETAMAYCRWESERTGLSWRLPRELEWEKTARGVDGRIYPWGDRFDPSWGVLRDSVERPMPQVVDAFPVDESPYGVRGLAGNVHDWCLDRFRSEGPRLEPVSAAEVPLVGEDHGRSLRGGCWHAGERWARTASRGVVPAHVRESVLGFRLARSLKP